MAAGKLKLKIITPERVVLDREVDELTATAVDGELSILPEHEPLVAALAIDVVRFKSGNEEDMAAIMGGVLEVRDDEVTVLSDLAELGLEIDEARAHQAQSKAEAEKTQKTDKLDVYVSEMALSKAMARLKASQFAKNKKGLRS